MRRVVVVGGGPYAARLCEVLAAIPELPEIELRLAARVPRRLRVVAAHAARRVERRRPDWRLEWTTSLEDAARGAEAGVLLVRIGGLEARRHDETFPARFGLVGDEGLGAGGIANAWRTLPALVRIAEALGRAAPGARWLNLCAPLGLTTRRLRDSGLDAVGLCELPGVTRDGLEASLGRPLGEAALGYGGLNHLGWFWARDAEGRAALEAAARDGSVDRVTLERYGAAPLRYFYELFDPEAGRRLGIVRRPDRAGELIALRDRLLERFAADPGGEIEDLDRRPTPWFDLAVAPALRAVLGGAPQAAHADVVNDGLLPELPAEAVVEVPAVFASSGVSPLAPGSLPPAVAEFLGPLAGSESLAYEAIRLGDPDAMAAAVAALPGAGSREQIAALTREICSPLPEVGRTGGTR